jgi:hypothetical protein
MPWTISMRLAIPGVSAETIPIAPTAAALQAINLSEPGSHDGTRRGYNPTMRELREPLAGPEPEEDTRIILPRWVTLVLALVAIGLVPWILYLTLSLPSRHVTFHYDTAWIGFDVGLFALFAATAWATFRGSRWLVPLAAATGTMLVCDAWFDVVTAQSGGERWEAIAEAALAELPLALVCAFIVYDAETFLAATVNRFRQ